VRALVLALVVLCGCGYTTRLELAPPYESASVELFSNDTYERDIEREFHVELTRSLRNLVDAPLLSPRHADLIVRGRVLEFFRTTGTRNRQNELVERRLAIRVRGELWSREEGRMIAGPAQGVTTVGYTTETLENERGARRQIIKNLSDEIILDLFAQLRAQTEN